MAFPINTRSRKVTSPICPQTQHDFQERWLNGHNGDKQNHPKKVKIKSYYCTRLTLRISLECQKIFSGFLGQITCFLDIAAAGVTPNATVSAAQDTPLVILAKIAWKLLLGQCLMVHGHQLELARWEDGLAQTGSRICTKCLPPWTVKHPLRS